ncbi:hypothetical protein L596_020238 [Steinernema carpocapsae]|uniref:Protein kinase domain-containing protein n=1 Tax=Steinernema carpocapsae TaxID=34508 RepID=A0A4V6A0V3_STECR|nr:hypothetical protein L596_020238 [Steinernema carpocapsae]
MPQRRQSIKPEEFILDGKFYSQPKIIGTGACGAVFRMSSGSHKVAVKMLKSATKDDVSKLKREVEVMREMGNHSNICKLLDCQDTVYGNFSYVIMEHADNHDLFDLVENQKCTPERSQRLFRQMCTGLQYMHRLRIVHGDLKPENVLIFRPLTAKLCDFGTSRKYPVDDVNNELPCKYPGVPRD